MTTEQEILATLSDGDLESWWALFKTTAGLPKEQRMRLEVLLARREQATRIAGERRAHTAA